jgi:tetratricopeptide (TPR) repeat protein
LAPPLFYAREPWPGHFKKLLQNMIISGEISCVPQTYPSDAYFSLGTVGAILEGVVGLVYHKNGDEYSASFVDQSIINCLIYLGRYDEALSRLEFLIPAVTAAEQIPLLTVLQRYQGRALFALGRVAEAEAVLEVAMASFEERRNSLDDDGSRGKS